MFGSCASLGVLVRARRTFFPREKEGKRSGTLFPSQEKERERQR